MTQADRRSRPSSKRLLLGLGAVLVLLSVVFGVTTVRSRVAFREYRERTLDQQPLPWTEDAMSVQECVVFSVDWAMGCPSMESWCANEAPQLTRQCMESADRASYCAAAGAEVDRTGFGYAQCEALRETLEGKYAKRSHKKFCAAAYRAVAEHCRRTR